MKDELATIYSQAYLEDVVYKAMFDGYAISDNAGSSAVSVARYYEEDVYLWQSKDYKTHFTGIRVYDYSTMQVRSLGKTDRCVVTINTWLEDSPDQVENIEILIALQDGEWYLDNFVG